MITPYWRGCLTFLLLLTALTLSALTYWHTTSSDFHLEKRANTDAPDSIATTVEMERFDKRGHLTRHIKAPRITHYPQHDVTYFQQPIITFYNGINQTPWIIKSALAILEQNGSKITLKNKVAIIKPKRDNKPATTISTSHLVYFPESERLFTKAPIVLTQGDFMLKGIGLTGNLKQQKINLLAKVKGVYDGPTQS